jgi:hypothetical protein
MRGNFFAPHYFIDYRNVDASKLQAARNKSHAGSFSLTRK